MVLIIAFLKTKLKLVFALPIASRVIPKKRLKGMISPYNIVSCKIGAVSSNPGPAIKRVMGPAKIIIAITKGNITAVIVPTAFS